MTAKPPRDLFLVVLVALASAAVLFLPLLTVSGIPRSYDLPDHLGATSEVLRGLREGLLYPRWFADVNAGWGEPTLLYYPPLLYAVSASLASLAGGDVLFGLFGALVLFALIGAAGVFVFVRRSFGLPAAALASLLFAGIPYRFFEIYAAGLYSAFAAACLIPWALGALLETAAEPPSSATAPAWPPVFAAVLLTNLPTGVMLAYLVAAWLVFRAVLGRRVANMGSVIGGGLWGSGLAAVYLAPALFEMRRVHVTFEEGTLYRSNFLFQSAGSWMRPGLKSTFDRMGIFSALALLVALALLEASRRRSSPALAARGAREWAVAVASFGIVSLFLLTPISGPAWRFLPYLKRINIPWRFLEPLGFAAASAAAVALWLLARERRVAGPVALLAVAFLALLGALCGYFDASLSVVNGRAPADLVRSEVPRFAAKPGFFLPLGARPPSAMPAMPLVACSPPCRVEVIAWGSERREFRLHSPPEGARALVRTYYFPGWSAESDGEELLIGPDAGTGAIVIGVPPGDHRITLRFRSTALRVAGSVVSGMALAAWIAAFVRSRLRRRRAPGAPGETPFPAG